jgi:hypothetical protein
MPIALRSLQSKSGITLRTRKGANVFPETSPQNSQAFGADNVSGGATLLAAPGAGFCWVITSLVVSLNPGVGNTVRITFTGGLAAQATMPTGGTAPAPAPAALVNSPTAMAANASFGYTVSGTGTASISGTAYKATVASVFNPQSAQVIATPIDSDPAGDIG